VSEFVIRYVEGPRGPDTPKFDATSGTYEERVARENIARCVAELGGVSAASRKLGATRQAIYFWLGGKHKISLAQAIELNNATRTNGLRVVDLAPHLREVIEALTA
tara:strand:+ start:1079 stop:1396 length:318 start_codon:yes stop_codon:yes gene_type:complete